MPSFRTVSLCFFLFAASALISISVRSHAYHPPRLESLEGVGRTSRFAYATFLSGDDSAKTVENPWPKDLAERDGYYLSARVLGYQLLHQPSTRTKASIPFLVLVTSSVSQAKRDRLAADGATIVVVPKLGARWIKPIEARWKDVLTKLRVAELITFQKICFIDADMLLTDNLDGVFTDTAVAQVNTGHAFDDLPNNEAPLPPSYTFAGIPDAWAYEHDYPPRENDQHLLNTGFFVVQPDARLFTYYVSLLNEANKDKLNGAAFPDQDLLNYAHRRDGSMPWKRLDWKWQANWPTTEDLNRGVKSFHAKYWDGDPGHDLTLFQEWTRVRDEMRSFYMGWDARRSEE